MSHKIKTQSLWRKTKLPSFSKVKSSKRFDVVVIGGGITGLTAAYLLKRAGKKVAVLERDHIGAGDTGQTTAHLTAVSDMRFSEQVKNFSKDAARLTWQAHASAIQTIDELVRLLAVNCEFRRVPGYLHAPLDGNKNESRQFSDEAELARELGIDAVYMPSVPYIGKPGVRFPNQAKFHPFKYLAALAQAVEGGGSTIYEGADAAEISEDPLAALIDGKRISGDYLVIATHVPLMGKSGLLSATLFQSKLAPYSSYVVGARVPHGVVPEACFWDTSDPYYYLRVNSGKNVDYVIFGGKDHKTGQVSDTEAVYSDLRARLNKLIPQSTFDCQWSGQVIETHDGLPYIGETAERQFVATGFAGNGMTFGTLGGMMACDSVLERENPWQELFSVHRKKIRAGAWDYVKENFDYPYYLVRDRLIPAPAKSPDDVKPGEGQVLRVDGKKVACYRDEEGKLSTVSAICTHMGCLVHWNNADATWDCPCHGSRFRPTGEVIGGPAESPLEQISTGQASSGTRSAKKSAPGSRKKATAQKKKQPRPGSGARSTSRESSARLSRQK